MTIFSANIFLVTVPLTLNRSDAVVAYSVSNNWTLVQYLMLQCKTICSSYALNAPHLFAIARACLLCIFSDKRVLPLNWPKLFIFSFIARKKNTKSSLWLQPEMNKQNVSMVLLQNISAVNIGTTIQYWYFKHTCVTLCVEVVV